MFTQCSSSKMLLVGAPSDYKLRMRDWSTDEDRPGHWLTVEFTVLLEAGDVEGANTFIAIVRRIEKLLSTPAASLATKG